jgi:hypothetical protein
MVDFTREITVLFMLALLVKNLSHVIFVSRALKSAKELGRRAVTYQDSILDR